MDKLLDTDEGKELAEAITKRTLDFATLILVQAKENKWDYLNTANTLHRQMFQIFTDDYSIYNHELFEVVFNKHIMRNTFLLKEYYIRFIQEIYLSQEEYIEFITLVFSNYSILIQKYGNNESKKAYHEAIQYASGIK